MVNFNRCLTMGTLISKVRNQSRGDNNLIILTLIWPLTKSSQPEWPVDVTSVTPSQADLYNADFHWVSTLSPACHVALHGVTVTSTCQLSHWHSTSNQPLSLDYDNRTTTTAPVRTTTTTTATTTVTLPRCVQSRQALCTVLSAVAQYLGALRASWVLFKWVGLLMACQW